MSTAVDDETILEVLRSNSAPQMTTTEVANHLPVTRGTTRTRLQRLVDDDLINRETEGNNVVWWLPERGEEREAWEPDAEEEPEVEEEEAEEEEEPEEEEAEEEESEAEETEDEAAEDAETEDAESEGDETEIAVTATEQSKAESEDGTEVEDEAVESEPDVETPDEATETRTAAEREKAAELSDDEEGLRVLAGVAVGLVAVILLRRLLGDDEE